MTPDEAYEWLRKQSVETQLFSALGELAAWDQRTCLPRKGHPFRSEQMANLAAMLHERETDPRIGECLAEAEGSERVADTTSPAAVNVREWRRRFDKLTRIPNRLAEALARATSEGETAWEEARKKSDWAAFLPHLEEIVSLLKEKAWTQGYEDEPYDALLDDYEPGETAAGIETLFCTLKAPLSGLIETIGESDHPPDLSVLQGKFDIRSQEAFSREIAAMLGFDFDGGRLDESAHPFTVGVGSGDVRITTRYRRDNLMSALLGTIHETGHGIYEQGLPRIHHGTPVGRPVSLGVHESQSRLYENFIGRSRGFWTHVLPMAKKHFPDMARLSLDRFLPAINAVQPSLIRVEADEVTYNLHIVMRFELELALFRGALSVSDLPDAWNEKMRLYFGLNPPDAGAGVLQDVHWSAGLIGYFPTYTLGNIYAAQLYYAATDEMGDLETAFQVGDFRGILDWLGKNIHEKGSTYMPRDLLEKATGAPPDPIYLLLYCQNKFKDLYQL